MVGCVALGVGFVYDANKSTKSGFVSREAIWKTKAEQHRERRRCTAARARCARVPRATVRLSALSSCKGGHFVPRLIPQTRAFSRWTRPDALRLLDFRPGGVSPSGHLTAVSTAASPRRTFVPSMDLQTGEDFALPLDPHRPGVCRPGPARGLCAHRPQRGFRAPAPRTGCVPPRSPCPSAPTRWIYRSSLP